MPKPPPIVAVGLDRAFPIDGERAFEELLRAIDDADCKLRPSEDSSACDRGSPTNILASSVFDPYGKF